MAPRVCTCKLDGSEDVKPAQKCPNCEKPRRKDKPEEKANPKSGQPNRQRKTKVTPPPENVGQLNTTRYMLDSRRDLHERHAETYRRHDELEKAVAQLQEKVEANPPRWLNYEPRAISSSPSSAGGPSPESLRTDSEPPPADPELLANAFGALSLRDARKTQYHGWNAIAEYVLQVKDEGDKDDPSYTPMAFPSIQIPTGFPPDLFYLQFMFPYPGPNVQKSPSMESFMTALPERKRATELMENYYTYFTWIASPVPLQDLREMYSMVYPMDGSLPRLDVAHAHWLAILLSVFLLGALFDFQSTQPDRSRECETYLMLARAAVACDPISEHITLQAVQAITLISWYLRLSPVQMNRTLQWALSGYLSKMVQELGLYRNGRDASLFIQDQEQISRAEQTFWEYHANDIWMCYMFGRPPSMTSEVIQCQWPPKVEVHPGHASDYFKWKFSFSKLLSEVMDTTSMDDIDYSAILKAEKRLRRHGVPDDLEWPGPGKPFPRGETVGRTFQRWCAASLENIAVMYLHRPFAWRAITEPGDIRRHPYWRSVVALFHSATSIVACGRKLWAAYPEILIRLAPFWSHTLSASQCLGVLACFQPGCLFAKGALMYFDEAVDMFISAGDDIQHLSKQRDQMRSIQKKAHQAFFEEQNRDQRSASESYQPASQEMITEFEMSFNHPAIPQRGQGRRAPKIEKPGPAPGSELAPDMPPGYEIYRTQEDGWEHLVSYN